MNRRHFLGHLGGSALGIGCLVSGSRGTFVRVAEHLLVRLPPPTRPFNIVACGDSVMWGQGLANAQKFSTLVQNWVQSQLPDRTVNSVFNVAHSGAIIDPNFTQDMQTVGGEVPDSFPSITGQVLRFADPKRRLVAAEDVDLVLLDGGINDVNVRNIVCPFSGPDEVREMTKDRLGTRMKYLLPIVTGTFPYAKVVVTGYFPIVSDDSPLLELAVALVAVGFFATVPAALTALALPALKARLVSQSSAFYDESELQLNAAVAQENARTPDRCVYVSPGFNSVNAYGASTRMLFNVAEDDPARVSREAQCNAAPDALNTVVCTYASMGHPNALGAQSYATNIIRALTSSVSKWRGLRSLVACVEPKPVIGQVNTYTVWVEDAETHRPVAGIVSMSADGSSFPTNTPFTYKFAPCTKRTVTRTGARDVNVEGGDCETISVAAPGYAGGIIAQL